MAVNLSPYGGVGAQFLDNAGNVLTGGKIFTYAAGTTTNQVTYTNSTGTIPHTNPIILNAAGRVPSGEIWLTDGLVYKFVLKDSNDVLIATYDNIIGINSNFVNYSVQEEIQTATAGQTVFTLANITYQPGTNSLTVFVDGVNQYDGVSYAYVETNSTTVTFTAGLHVGALVKFTTAVTLSAGVTNANLVVYDPPFTGSVPTTVELKLSQTVSPKDFGAVGNGVADDTNAFSLLEAEFTGEIINLSGYSYVVNAYPTGNTYVNGNFIVSAVTFDASQDKATISSLTDTGGIDPAYTGGVNNTPTISGRTNSNTRAIIASQNCRSQFARSINVASIYSWAYGNVSGNYSARQCVAGAPQAVNSASEECVVYGFRGANIVGHYSGVWGGGGGNFSARYSDTSARHAVNIASVSANAGYGFGAVLDVTVTAGQVTAVAITEGGEGYENGASLSFYDRETAGSGAIATVVVDGNGTVTSIVLTNGGTGYSANTDAVVDASGDYSANIATTNGCNTTEEASANLASNDSQVLSIRSANIATDECVVAATGEVSGNFASSVCTVTGSRATTLASTGSTATGSGALVLSGNICEADADGAVVFGRRTINDQTRSIAFGDAVSGSASTANRKFHLFASGNMSIAGTLTQSAIFTDYAEYFENVANGKIELGTLVSLDGRKVKPTQEGDDILGVVSATASIAAGDSPFQWSKRYLTGEFGELLYHDILDPDWQPMVKDPSWKPTDDNQTENDRPLVANPNPQPTISVPVENPNYNPTAENVPRSKRPDEWTCVGLLGQVHVRIANDVSPGDYVKTGANGVGVKSSEITNMRCMEIRKEFDANKGYAVGFCLLK